jgi:hypothetical protein
LDESAPQMAAKATQQKCSLKEPDMSLLLFRVRPSYHRASGTAFPLRNSSASVNPAPYRVGNAQAIDVYSTL